MGYIKERKAESGKQKGISEKFYCLDNSCFRKELNFDRTDREYFSRIVS
ncbi:MAG: hypothetical protein LBC61_04565 [Candidatus Peribacteria bacterium]|nr:hypothetical protein [Candidatus Peribacteria bacterium]